MTQKIRNQSQNRLNQAWGWALPCLGALFLLSPKAPAQAPVPIPCTGWNVEIIAANDAASPAAGTSQSIADGFALFELGAPTTTDTIGFPTNGIINSAGGQKAQFVIPTSNGGSPYSVYHGDDALEGGGTLTLVTPCHFYNYLSLLTENPNGGGSFTVTLNFSDSTTSSYSANAGDWTGGASGDYAIALGTGLVSDGSSWGGQLYYANFVHAWEVDIPLNSSDSAKTVNSIAISPPSGGVMAVFGIAALTNAPVPPSSAPTILTVTTNAGPLQVGLTWSSVSNATTYNVKRSLTNGGPYTTIGSTAGTSYNDRGLNQGTTYYYVVSAANGGGEGPNSAQVAATAGGWAPYTAVPIALTGWNEEIIAANDAASPSAGTSKDVSYGFAFYEQGAPGAPYAGFPINNFLYSGGGMQEIFQIQPYHGNNGLLLGNGDTNVGTLTLTTPCHFYNDVEFLVEGVNNPSWTVQLNFSDGSSSAYSTSDCDWTACGPGAAAVGLTTHSAGSWSGSYYNNQVYLFENDITLSPCDSSKAVSSITITLTGGNGLVVFAVDAQTNQPVFPPPTTNAVIVLDQFNGPGDVDGTAIDGRMPYPTDLPGVTYTPASGPDTYPCCSNPSNAITTAIGNPAPSAAFGFDNYSGVSLASQPLPSTYGKPSHFHIQADVEGDLSAGDTVRGWFVGFSSAPGPNGVIGHQGAGNLSGLWLCDPSSAYGTGTNAVIVLQPYGQNYLNWAINNYYTNHIIAYWDSSILGPYSPASTFYTVGYDVDTGVGTITNVFIANTSMGATQYVAGTFGSAYGSPFTDANTMYAFVASSANFTSSSPVGYVDNFEVVGLPAVYHAPPPPPPPANVIFDQFSTCDFADPDTVNLPGGTWSGAAYFNYVPYPSIDIANGNPSYCAQAGASAQMWIPITSAGSYTEPNYFRLSADLELGTIGAGDVVRGIMLGVMSGSVPTNAFGQRWCGSDIAGHEGADNFAGLWLDPGEGDLYIQGFGNSYLGKPGDDQYSHCNGGCDNMCGTVTNRIPIWLYETNDNTLGAWSANKFYHLSFWVNGSAGTISGITLSDATGSASIPGVYSLQDTNLGDTYLPTKLANVGIQFSSGSAGGVGYVDNVGVFDPTLFKITSITKSGNDIVLVWNTMGTSTNVVQVSSSLNPASFSNASGPIVIPGSGDVSQSYTIAGGATAGAARYYRIALLQ